jgi:hypothetical protein
MSNREATALLLGLAFVATIIWGVFEVFHFDQTGIEQPWVQIILFIGFTIGLGFCIYGLIKVRRNKSAGDGVLWPTIGLITGIVVCLGFVIYEIAYFITNIL